MMYGFDIAWRGTSIPDYPVYAPMEDGSALVWWMRNVGSSSGKNKNI